LFLGIIAFFLIERREEMTVSRSFSEEKEFVVKLNDYQYEIQLGFVPNMKVKCHVYVNESLFKLLMEELQQFVEAKGVGGFLPALKQTANVASLPGAIGVSKFSFSTSFIGNAIILLINSIVSHCQIFIVDMDLLLEM
jgi:hypothetical protein